ncbi:MAG TPA: type III-A CRISPR-associated protein Csm2 [Candidatus Cloacimonadota bacterium]|nr:type III-A CRISPR-associated protein Csm2 [Candidatus Cloacimonadota bacterium]
MPFDKNQKYEGQKERNQYDFKEPFFKDNKLNLVWVSSEAEKFSNYIADSQSGNRQDKAITPTALRNFYNEMLRIRDLGVESKDEQLALIRLLIAKVKYKQKQQGSKIPQDFVEFMNKLVDEVNDDISRFNQACLIMEAIVGYYPK